MLKKFRNHCSDTAWWGRVYSFIQQQSAAGLDGRVCVPLYLSVQFCSSKNGCIFVLVHIQRFLIHVWYIRGDRPLQKNNSRLRVYHGVWKGSLNHAHFVWQWKIYLKNPLVNCMMAKKLYNKTRKKSLGKKTQLVKKIWLMTVKRLKKRYNSKAETLAFESLTKKILLEILTIKSLIAKRCS